MKRLHLFEFMDQSWYPALFRRMQTDYLQFVVTRGSGHEQLIPLIKKALHHTRTTEIVDLCSGGTGPWLKLQPQLAAAGCPVTVKLTDKYPDPESVHKQTRYPNTQIEYLAESVDAMQVPSQLRGMRMLFEGFHHFKPEQAQAILQDAAEHKMAIGIFEAGLKPPLSIPLLLLMPFLTLLGYWVITPGIRPRSLARIFWTYLVPIVPLVTIWDGIVSFLRVYSPPALKVLADQIQVDGYVWEMGQVSAGTPLFAYIYLIGYPATEWE
ncbi:MAG TPA: hypothetical protein VHO69_00805 [Phototrophicaceae bacterium]|nr:hypothetical protein [Phototrophicaceae bacterium]